MYRKYYEKSQSLNQVKMANSIQTLNRNPECDSVEPVAPIIIKSEVLTDSSCIFTSTNVVNRNYECDSIERIAPIIIKSEVLTDSSCKPASAECDAIEPIEPIIASVSTESSCIFTSTDVVNRNSECDSIVRSESTDHPVTQDNIPGSREGLELSENQCRNMRRRKKNQVASGTGEPSDNSTEGAKKGLRGKKKLSAKKKLRAKEWFRAKKWLRAKKSLLSDLVTPSNEKARLGPTSTKTYTEKVKLIRMAVIKETFPRRKINEANSKLVQEHLLDVISKMPSSTQLPMIKSILPQGGFLIVNCEDAFTTNWLTNALDENRTVLGVKLKVMDAKNLPKLVKMAFCTKDLINQDGEKLLKILQKYHPTFNTGSWRILRKFDKTTVIRWVYEMDERSAKAVEDANFVGRTGLGKGIFKHLPANPPRRPEASTPTATVTTATLPALELSEELAYENEMELGTSAGDNPSVK